jgi:hypothetical protein
MTTLQDTIATYLQARQALSRCVDAKILDYIDSFKNVDDATAGNIFTVIDYYDDMANSDSINGRQCDAFMTAASQLNQLKEKTR